MINKLELALIFVAVLTGVVSTTYFYLETGIFMKILKKSLRMVAMGMFIISIGVMLSAYINYSATIGISISWAGVPAPAYFYCLYLIGSMLILFGARKFATRPSFP